MVSDSIEKGTMVHETLVSGGVSASPIDHGMHAKSVTHGVGTPTIHAIPSKSVTQGAAFSGRIVSPLPRSNNISVLPKNSSQRGKMENSDSNYSATLFFFSQARHYTQTCS